MWSVVEQFLIKKKVPQHKIPEILERFDIYTKLLKDWNSKINLTAIKQDSEIVTRHFLDSICGLEFIEPKLRLSESPLVLSNFKNISSTRGNEFLIINQGEQLPNIPQNSNSVDSQPIRKYRMMDVGTGAGFPGLPLAIVYPEVIEMTLVDAVQKKIKYLEFVTRELGLEKTVHPIHTRIESLGHDPKYREQQDIVMTRAFSSLRTSIEVLAPLTKTKGWLLMYKRGDPTQEMKEALLASVRLKTDMKMKYMTVENVEPVSTLDDRCLVLAEKIDSCSKKYPRLNKLPWTNPI